MKNVLSDKLTMVPGGDYRIEPDTVMVVIGKNQELRKMRGR
jgi:Trk K+ transport system NAD-binding subunit